MAQRLHDEISHDAPVREQARRYAKGGPFSNANFVSIDHHVAHGRSSYILSGFEESLVLTVDGRGDGRSLTVYLSDHDSYSLLQEETTVDSLGYFYGRVTDLLGFKANEQEGKVSGLAANGDPDAARILIDAMIGVDASVRVRSKIGAYYKPWYDTSRDSELQRVASKYEAADIAAAAQVMISNVVISVIDRWISDTGIRNVCLGGGVFENVRLVQDIRETSLAENVFVAPAPGDVGLPLQAAVVASDFSGYRTNSLTTVKLGTPASHYSTEIVASAEARGFRIFHQAEVRQRLLECLARGFAIGTFRGAAEFGQRALCNRSILCSAADRSVSRRLSTRLRRDEFMPFSPVLAVDFAAKCFPSWSRGDTAAEFMLSTYTASPFLRELCPVVVHVDGTARPQFVTADTDTFLHDLLLEWHQRTGEPALVNTSFNAHGRPIVDTYSDVIDYLTEGVVDGILTDNSLIVKREDIE